MHNPIDDLVAFTLWLQAKHGVASINIEKEALQKLAEEWYEMAHGDEHEKRTKKST